MHLHAPAQASNSDRVKTTIAKVSGGTGNTYTLSLLVSKKEALATKITVSAVDNHKKKDFKTFAFGLAFFSCKDRIK